MFADETGIMVASHSVSDLQNLLNDYTQSLVNWLQLSKLGLMSYLSFKRTVHPGNSKNKRLLLDPCHLTFCYIVSVLVCTLPV